MIIDPVFWLHVTVGILLLESHCFKNQLFFFQLFCCEPKHLSYYIAHCLCVCVREREREKKNNMEKGPTHLKLGSESVHETAQVARLWIRVGFAQGMSKISTNKNSLKGFYASSQLQTMLVIQNFYNHSLNRNIRHSDSDDKDKS